MLCTNRLLLIPVILGLVSCGRSDTNSVAQVTSTPSLPKASAVADPATHLCKSWLAIGVTINGQQDPDMDPTGKVEFTLSPDSTFTMHDATEGVLETMSGRWQWKVGNVLVLVDDEFNEVTEFRVTELSEKRLVTHVLEETEVEVLLHYEAK